MLTEYLDNFLVTVFLKMRTLIARDNDVFRKESEKMFGKIVTAFKADLYALPIAKNRNSPDNQWGRTALPGSQTAHRGI